ncbi:MAG: membrane protein insertase YidC [Phycisphaeraceae bacterium]
MAKKESKSSLARILVPLIVGLVGAMVVLSQMNPSDKKADGDTDPTTPPAEQAGDETPTEGPAPAATAEGEDEPEQPETDPEPGDATAEGETPEPEPADEPEVAVGKLDNPRAAFADKAASLDEPDDLLTLGSFDPEAGYEIAARINPYRASIYDLSVVNKYHKVNREEQYKLLNPISFDLGEANYPEAGSYAASYLIVNGQRVKLWKQDLQTSEWHGHWNVDSASASQIVLSMSIIAGPEDSPTSLARVTRTYEVVKADQPGSYTVKLTQQVKNLTDEPMTITWEQMAQGGVYHATNDYLRGRSQQYVLGHYNLDYDAARFAIYVEDGFLPEPDIVSKLKDPSSTGKWKTVWPNPKIDEPETKELAWLASENRYFVAISSAPVAEARDDLEPADLTALQAIYPKISTTIYPDIRQSASMKDEDRRVIIDFTSNAITLKPGGQTKASDLSLDLFAGPREDAIFAQQPYRALQYDKTIRYSLGGCFGFCTFQWLANLLLGFLELLHSVIFDWGVAIVILVLVVRLILHPLTKRGQTNMLKMGKQMAAVQPEINKLKKKFADDPRQLQQEQMKLFREKGINPAAGAIGCLPMFLQMPIWIALYAMLYYAIELRHEPAFYGVFQMIADWPFLADLSSADRFIPLGPDDGTWVFNLIFIRLDYSSINILPILMGITFFINMKFTTPPPMNEQQANQQKIMRIMPLLFPFFLYSAPAGLTLYICASTMAGIVDSYIVRKHVKQLEESGELFKPKQPKPGGFMDKLQKMAEAKQAQMDEMKKQQQQNKGPQNYKKRKR